ncbi:MULTISPECIES: DUF6270 domain-containing protein [Bacillaceae]|jgi:hypothetical protein|uniref:DUF6270 domain-containing protein n=1 Tax=Bacillaceae TaxID=186817 RepID=UPI001F39CDE0|nr:MULTISPECIES: DUF6270 domain-containing protein [Bacillaceae]MCF2647755.1 hypothetical protein [Niallia circulans]CAI9385748.1 hypothetical protein BACSP_00139 [Bacillus sp. T2.9-1]
MAYRIAVIGSCVSRDVFNSNIIPDYKELYEVVSTVWQTSIPSLISKKIKITDEDMELSKELSKHRLNTLKRDIKKTHLKELIESKPDFIIIDFFADIRYGYVKLNSSENYYLTNNPNGFRQTRFYKEKKYGKTYNVHKNKRFYEFFYNSFDKFYNMVKEELPKTVILINGFVESYGYIGPEKYPLRYDEETLSDIHENNKEYLSIYKHLEENYSDITVIEMSKKIYFGDPDHMFGNAPYHMTREYYNDLYNRITQQVLKFEQNKQ